jgi:hypothetical protein
MKKVTTKDVLYSVYAAETEHDAIKILDRYVEHLVNQQKVEWVAEVRAERQKKFDGSNFTNAIEYMDRMMQLSKPNHHEILMALKMVAEAFREREDRFYRRPPQ